MGKVAYGTPPASLVDAYLSEIARGYNIDWHPDGKSDDDSGDNGGLKVCNAIHIVVGILARCSQITHWCSYVTIRHPCPQLR